MSWESCREEKAGKEGCGRKDMKEGKYVYMDVWNLGEGKLGTNVLGIRA